MGIAPPLPHTTTTSGEATPTLQTGEAPLTLPRRSTATTFTTLFGEAPLTLPRKTTPTMIHNTGTPITVLELSITTPGYGEIPHRVTKKQTTEMIPPHLPPTTTPLFGFVPYKITKMGRTTTKSTYKK